MASKMTSSELVAGIRAVFNGIDPEDLTTAENKILNLVDKYEGKGSGKRGRNYAADEAIVERKNR